MAEKSKSCRINGTAESFHYWVSKLNAFQDLPDAASSSTSTRQLARQLRKRRKEVEEAAVGDAEKRVCT